MFRRLTVPSYFGALPGGYGYINNAISGTPANADGAKSGGPNNGTFFIGFGEDATSADANRPAKALAENCDFLDDLFRRDIAVRTKTAPVTTGGTVASVAVAVVGQYVGESGTPNTAEGIATFAEVVDANGETIFAAGVPVRITSITGAAPGDGFSGASSITYAFTPSIPAAVTYQIRYSKRGNLATLPVDQFSSFKTRTFLGTRTYYAGSGGTTWATGDALDPSSVDAAISSIVGGLGALSGATLVGAAERIEWADGTPNPDTNVADALNKIVADLSGAGGTAKVQGNAAAGTTFSLPSDTLSAQLVAIKNELDAIRTAGVHKIQRFADLNALRVFGSPIDKHIYAVDNLGLYQYYATAVITEQNDNDFDAIIPDGFVETDPPRYYLLGPGRRLIKSYADVTTDTGETPSTSQAFFTQNLAINDVSAGDVVEVEAAFYAYALSAMPADTAVLVDVVLTKANGTTVVATGTSAGIANHFSAVAPSSPFSAAVTSRIRYIVQAADIDSAGSGTLHARPRYHKSESGGSITARVDCNLITARHLRP